MNCDWNRVEASIVQLHEYLTRRGIVLLSGVFRQMDHLSGYAHRPFHFALRYLRKRRNLRDMRTTLERIKSVVED